MGSGDLIIDSYAVNMQCRQLHASYKGHSCNLLINHITQKYTPHMHSGHNTVYIQVHPFNICSSVADFVHDMLILRRKKGKEVTV